MSCRQTCLVEFSGGIATPVYSGTSIDYSLDLTYSSLITTRLREMFGDEVGDEVSSGLGVDTEKLADVLRELPLPEAEIFDAKMKEKDTDSLD